jgi:hypothetical protein
VRIFHDTLRIQLTKFSLLNIKQVKIKQLLAQKQT